MGAAYCRGEYLFFLNPDIQLEKNSLDFLLEVAVSNKQLGILAPTLVNDDYTPAELPLKYPTLLSTLSDLPILNHLIPIKYKTSFSIFGTFSVPIETDWVLGAAMLITNKLFKLIGGFDEAFFLFSEDIDLCFRVKKANFQVLYSPVTKIRHSGGGTTNKVSYVRETILWESTFLYFRKHRGIFYSLIARILVFLAYSIEYTKNSLLFLLEKSTHHKDRNCICVLAIKTALGYQVVRP